MLPRHARYDYSPLIERKDYSWPGKKRLAFCITTNIECYAFGKGRGHDNAKHGEPQTQRNYSWRDYGNRVGLWRMMELMDKIGIERLYSHQAHAYDVALEGKDVVVVTACGWTSRKVAGEVVPTLKSIRLPKIDETVRPDFEIRRFNVRFATVPLETFTVSLKPRSVGSGGSIGPVAKGVGSTPPGTPIGPTPAAAV